LVALSIIFEVFISHIHLLEFTFHFVCLVDIFTSIMANRQHVLSTRKYLSAKYRLIRLIVNKKTLSRYDGY